MRLYIQKIKKIFDMGKKLFDVKVIKLPLGRFGYRFENNLFRLRFCRLRFLFLR